MKYLKLAVLSVLLLVLVLGLYQHYIQQDPLESDRTEISFEGHVFNVEIADTPEERRKGLMNCESLGENEGMLFVYKDQAPRSFWMKNTSIPLDIIFLDSEMKVINIEKAEPGIGLSDSELPRYRSERPARYVLEINQNRSDEIGLEKGEKMNLGLDLRP